MGELIVLLVIVAVVLAGVGLYRRTAINRREAAERAALKRERDALATAAKALGLSLRVEVRAAVTDGLAAAATEGVQAVETATAVDRRQEKRAAGEGRLKIGGRRR